MAQRLQDGDLDARAVPPGPEETVELAETMNRLADRIDELLAAERAAVGDLSHRLRTPVTALRLDAEAVPEERAREPAAGAHRAPAADDRRDRADARRPLRTGLTASCDATAVVASRVAFWSALAEDQGRRSTSRLPDDPVPGAVWTRSDLTDLLDVLVDNVFAHTPDDAGFAVALERDEHGAVLEVADEGPGLGRGARTAVGVADDPARAGSACRSCGARRRGSAARLTLQTVMGAAWRGCRCPSTPRRTSHAS